MKISTARIKQIIKEELFYREFYRNGQQLAEDKVEDKISKLKDEGKPHDQAVAIALDMEKRGDLEESEEAYRVVDAEKDRRRREKWMKTVPPEDLEWAGTQNLGQEDEPEELRTIRPGDPLSFRPAKKHEGKKASKTVGDPPYREQGSTESQAQQMAAGAALSARRGDTPVSKLKGASLDLYHGEITTKELRNLAKLGQKVKGHKSKEPKHRKSLPGHTTPAKD